MKKHSKKSTKKRASSKAKPSAVQALGRHVRTISKKVAALARVHTLPRASSGRITAEEHLRRLGFKPRSAAALASRLGPRRPNPQKAYDVYLNGKFLDTVYMTGYTSIHEVQRELVRNQDYDSRITVRERKMGMPRRANPAGGFVDTQAARELKLFIDNDAQLYRQQMEPIQKNLVRKLVKGTYQHAQAPKLWMYLVDNGARKYTKEYGSGDGMGTFNKPTRLVVANELAEEFYSAYRNGEYDYLIPEKQRTKSAPRPNPSRGDMEEAARLGYRLRRLEKAGFKFKLTGGTHSGTGSGSMRQARVAMFIITTSHPRYGEITVQVPVASGWPAIRRAASRSIALLRSNK